MAFEDEFLELMPHTLVVKEPSGTRNVYGRATSHEEEFEWQCLIQQEAKLTRASNGDEVTSTTQAYGPPTPAISVNAEVTFPDGSTRPLIGVSLYADDEGAHNQVLMFQ